MNVALLANENFSAQAIRKLRAAGVDTVSVCEIMLGISDQKVRAFARREQRWILTFDRDYGDLVFREGLRPPPAILYFRQEPFPPDRPADWVMALLAEPIQADGCMVVIGGHTICRKRFPPTADE